jgi:eukaryotic-like serine/threonine-protein kinase
MKKSQIKKVESSHSIEPVRIENYSISGLLHSGRYSKVFTGYRDTDKIMVLVKSIPKLFRGADIRFLREKKIPTLISHPSIRTIIDSYENQDCYYLIYYYQPVSFTLDQFTKRPLSTGQAFSAICQIASAILTLHQNQIVHRDIKPSNIIVCETESYLIDFDLAGIVGNTIYPVHHGLVGTPDYLSPEMLNKEEIIDYYAVDIYAFGITLYYAFNRRFPYDVDWITSFENSKQVINSFSPISSSTGIETFDSLIMKMISKNPIERPKIKDVLSELEGISLLK